ncbi:cation:proton antiporter [Tissierella sp.]|uniref:cation:proton antiporter n=1 Tax=Tissierella sp. TaxID=41274 RepID=UPI00286148D7|nr:cation:proton antiporter [Tissierella sp.]MDR7855557.1 cation:proton antiporter [Tissierella sp.]
MILLILRLLIAASMAFFMGKLISKIRLPSILGWLITGMILGPYAVGVVNNELLNASWYQTTLNILECGMGMMIGTELVLKELKRSGKQIVITTITQSLGTFFVVTLFFGIIFYFIGVPLYISLIFGGIALATAPAPALSIVKEFKTDGPVTRTLIPMAVLDDIVAIIVFFSIITFITAANAEVSTPLYQTLAMMILLPIAIGVAVGLVGGVVLKKERSKNITLMITLVLILLVSSVGFIFNNLILAQPVLNFMLIGMAFSATFANIVSEERLSQIMNAFSPILGISMLIVILNLGAPLDYHLILGAGIFTAIYIISRAIGKYTGAFWGAKMTGLPETVQKYLGLTLLPHSGVSLVFTGIAVTTLNTFDPTSAAIIQGTIAAAAVINEVIAVIISKKAFEWAGEFGKATD